MFQNYITMKKLLTLFAIALAVMVSSCSKFDDSAIWDKLNEQEQTLNDHEKRIAALEELCKQMNTNINALQTLVEALEKRDYITNVSPVREDGVVVGYTISFANSDTITIYNGKDGKDGVDGKDGYTPQIGIMKDTDGIYYWTIDGEWLLDGKGDKIKAVGEDGRDGQDGTDGTNGSNGSNGQDGQDGEDGSDGRDGIDGITPRLKIENDYWYVSYDDGATWIELGKATGEDGVDGSDGTNGSDGEDGDSIFASVTQDDEYVYFNLADGTMITLPKHDKENIQFEDLQVKAICCKNWDTNFDGELSYTEAAAVTDIGTVFKGNTDIIAFTELRHFTGLSEIPTNAFNGCTTLWKVVLPDNLNTIGNSAFNGCTGIANLVLPNSVTNIGNNAFFGCSSLTNVVIPNGIASIGYAAFRKCISLSSITIPNSIVLIDDYAFADCTGIENVTIQDQASSSIIGVGAFQGCTKLSYLVIGNGVTLIKSLAFQDCNKLNSITIPQSVTSIGCNAFDIVFRSPKQPKTTRNNQT